LSVTVKREIHRNLKFCVVFGENVFGNHTKKEILSLAKIIKPQVHNSSKTKLFA